MKWSEEQDTYLFQFLKPAVPEFPILQHVSRIETAFKIATDKLSDTQTLHHVTQEAWQCTHATRQPIHPSVILGPRKGTALKAFARRHQKKKPICSHLRVVGRRVTCVATVNNHSSPGSAPCTHCRHGCSYRNHDTCCSVIGLGRPVNYRVKLDW